jgi:hypothetical protein
MQLFWENIRRSIAAQPIPKNFFPIRVGDVVDSPYGPFQVTSRRLVNCMSNEDATPDTPIGSVTTLWEGFFPDWQLTVGQKAQAVLNENLLENHRKIKICCFDCEAKSVTNFHFLGLECQSCKGFNTAQI